MLYYLVEINIFRGIKTQIKKKIITIKLLIDIK